MKTSDRQHEFAAIIIMGVSGCGKTTIASQLAQRLDWAFIESDAFHSEEQVQKMAAGIPLDDSDRRPWLETLHNLLVRFSRDNQPVVMACSALKEKYRQTLRADLTNTSFVFLKGSYELILQRMQRRRHFMKPGMLQSQFDALEEPQDALVIEIAQSPGSVTDEILAKFNFSGSLKSI